MSKRILAIVLSLVMVIGLTPAMAFAETEPAEDYGKPGKDYVEGQAIVCLKGTTSTAKLAKQNGMGDFEFETLMKADGLSGGKTKAAGAKATATGDSKVLALVDGDEKTADLIKRLEQNPQVEYAEPNYIVKPYGIEPADPGYPYQWHLKNQQNRQSSAAQIPAADTNISKAWEKAELSGKSEKAVIAVLDTGVDYNHPDLKDIMWDDGLKIPALKAMGGGKYGYNIFKGQDSDDPMDTGVGHGTHCAGIIASQWNDQGAAGVNGKNIEIMAIRFMGLGGRTPEADPTIAEAVKGYAYIQTAAENGVNIVAVNNSWGTDPTWQVTNSIMTATDIVGQKYGIISCFAAGNESSDNDLNTAGIRTGNYVINVGAMDSTGAGALFSNYGKRTVDVFAPGTSILSTTTSDKSLPEQAVNDPPQYLPQIMDKGQSWFYEDFEDKEDKIRLRLVDKDFEIVESAKSVSGPGTSGRGLQLPLDAIAEGAPYIIEMTIPKAELEGIETEAPVYMAFQGRWDNAAYGATFLVGYVDKEGSVKMLNDGRLYCTLTVQDHGWNQFSSLINNTEFLQSVEDDVRILLMPYSGGLALSEGAEGKSPVFHLDNVGIGKSAVPYHYSDGTSAATPVVAGLAGLLTAGTDLTPEEIVARIKGGVNRQDAIGLKDKSISDGFIDAAAAFDETKCVPVLNKLNVSGDTAVLDGYFFGNEKGILTIDGKTVSPAKWTDREITFNLPENMIGMQEVRIVRAGMDAEKDYGKNFFNVKQQDSLGFRSLSAPDLSYGKADGSGYPLTSADFHSGDLAAADGKIARLAYNWDNFAWAMEIYDIASDTWKKAPVLDLFIPENSEASVNTHSMTASGKKLYLSYLNKETKTCFAIYDLSKDSWKKVTGHDLKGGEALVTYRDKLLAIGGETTDTYGQKVPVSTVKILDPNTGKVIGKLPDLPQARRGVKAFASGDKLYICGSYDIHSEDLLKNEEERYDNIMVYDGKDWTVSTEPFLSDEFSKFDQGQTLDYGFGAVNNGLFAVGPVKNLGGKDMRDTWFYDTEKNTWSAREDIRYCETKTTNNQGVCYNGSFYVLSAARRASEPIVFRELPGVSYTGPKDQLITQPAAPKIKAESSLTSTKLSWNKVSGATGYEIYRASSKNGTYKKVFTTTKQSGTNTGLTTGKTYYYKVRAYKKSGNATIYGKYSGWLAATPKPAVPTFKLSALDNGAKVTWNKVSGASGYKIYRATSKNGTYKLIKTAKSTDRSYTSKYLKNKKTYYYKVRAYKVVNGKNIYSKYSVIKSVRTK